MPSVKEEEEEEEKNWFIVSCCGWTNLNHHHNKPNKDEAAKQTHVWAKKSSLVSLRLCRYLWKQKKHQNTWNDNCLLPKKLLFLTRKKT